MRWRSGGGGVHYRARGGHQFWVDPERPPGTDLAGRYTSSTGDLWQSSSDAQTSSLHVIWPCWCGGALLPCNPAWPSKTCLP